jgi:transposase
MTRNYKRKGARRWSDRDGRMALAARLSAEGKSLREIGAELSISPATAMRDLRRWDETRTALPANVFQFSVSSDPSGGEMKHLRETPRETPTTTGEALGLSVKEEMMARAVALLTDRTA